MTQIKFYISVSLLFLLGCNFLDVVPDDKPTVEDFYKNELAAKKTLYGLYYSIPDGFNNYTAASFCGSDELITSPKGLAKWFPYKYLLYEEFSPSDPKFNSWSYNYVSSGGDDGSVYFRLNLYAAIRKCHQFINNVYSVPNLKETDAEIWTGEAEFLIAFYHFYLLKYYGPIIIVDKEYDIDSIFDEDPFTARAPYDDCVNFIVSMLDRAIAKLPEKQTALTDYGRATSVAARALKSRLLLYAASPLFNGNSEFYSNFKNLDGTLLINQNYDAEKWERARVAAQEAITAAESAGIFLYYSTDKTDADPFKQAVLNYRYTFVDKWNSELIWGLTRYGKSTEKQQQMVPSQKKFKSSKERPLGNLVPTMSAVLKYYTKNGLPLDVDPETKDKDLFVYLASAKTAELNLNREPRFYASIGYDGGEYEFANSKFTIKAFSGADQGFKENQQNYSSSGYFSKKWVHPESNYDEPKGKFFSPAYPSPELRLAELYLNYAEADFEYDGVLSPEGLNYLNLIRKRAGIPNIEIAWSTVGGIPTGDALRDLIRQERSIEMMMESTRFFDIRRWKIAHIVMNGPMDAWNIYGKTADAFYKKVNMDESGIRHFTSPRNYLHPIHIEDINVNKNLVQNPGW